MSVEGFPLFLASIAVLLLLGVFIVRLILPKEFSNALAWAFAPAVGAGVCSLIEFAFRRPMFTVEIVLLIALSVIWFVRNGMRMTMSCSLQVPVIGILLAVVLGWALAESMTMVEHLPHGGTDGWAIWNSHSRFLFRDGAGWAAHIWNSYHADYPLLVPLMVARVWRYAGESQEFSGLFGILFGFSGVAILGVVLAELRGTMRGCLMALVLISTPLYLQNGASQEGDVPLSVFYLAAVALICLHSERKPDRRGAIVLAGFMTGCAGWTKNEGELFIAASCFVMLLPFLWKPAQTLRKFGAFALGLALPLAAILAFKMTNTTHSDLFENRHTAEVMAKIMAPERYWLIAKTVLHTAGTFGAWAVSPMIPIAALLVLTGICWRMVRSRAWLGSVAILCLVFAGYLAIYVITPMDLQWHLDSSLVRLMLQLWPAVLLLAGLAGLGRETPQSGNHEK